MTNETNRFEEYVKRTNEQIEKLQSSKAVAQNICAYRHTDYDTEKRLNSIACNDEVHKKLRNLGTFVYQFDLKFKKPLSDVDHTNLYRHINALQWKIENREMNEQIYNALLNETYEPLKEFFKMQKAVPLKLKIKQWLNGGPKF